MNISDLSGAALDWAVFEVEFGTVAFEFTPQYRPSTDWAQGGPIIEREKIDVLYQDESLWLAVGLSMTEAEGPTPLIAAMRCYVASKLGDDISIPEELST